MSIDLRQSRSVARFLTIDAYVSLARDAHHDFLKNGDHYFAVLRDKYMLGARLQKAMITIVKR